MSASSHLIKLGLTNHESASLSDLTETAPAKLPVGFCSSTTCANGKNNSLRPVIWPEDKRVEKCPRCKSAIAIFWKALTPGQITELKRKWTYFIPLPPIED